MGSIVIIPDRYKDLVKDADRTERGSIERYCEVFFKERGRTDRSCTWSRIIGDHDNYSGSMAFAQCLKEDNDTGHRSHSAVIFSRLYLRGFRQAEKALSDLMRDVSDDVRASIAIGFGYDHSGETVSLLKKIALDSSPKVRKSLVKNIWSNKDLCQDLVFDYLRDPHPSVREAMLNELYFDDGEVNFINEDVILNLCKDEDASVRSSAITVCSLYQSPAITSIVIQSLHDSEFIVRVAAVGTICHFQIPETLPALLNAARDSSSKVREAAINCLRGKRGAEVVKVLLGCSSDHSSIVRRYVAMGLRGQTTAEMLPVLKKLVCDQADANTRLAAVQCLSDIYTPEVEAILIHALQDKKEMVKRGAKKILAKWAKSDLTSKEGKHIVKADLERVTGIKKAFRAENQGGSAEGWGKFLEGLRNIDVAPCGDSKSLPSVIVCTETGQTSAFIVCGASQWIRLDYIQPQRGMPYMRYAIGTTELMEAWWQKAGPVQVRHGERLATDLGWLK